MADSTNAKIIILDTSYFIKLKPLNLIDGTLYITTDYIVKEIRDEKARDFYKLNKDFIKIRNPNRENMHHIKNFAFKSNDLKALSVPDISILALAYEIIKEQGTDSLLRSQPIEFKLKEKAVKPEKEPEPEPVQETPQDEAEDEGEWIGMENIEQKLNLKVKTVDNQDDQIKTALTTADFTVQNVALKMGIPVISIDGLRIRKIKNYILKCNTCETLNWDTTRQFCEHCGYNTLMKIGYSVDNDGNVMVYDKKADIRNRGTQYDLPKPSLSKKAVIYILSEDQLKTKKKEFSLENNLDKILDNYDSLKELNDKFANKGYNTSKNFVWGYPKKNPNAPKKYYSKKSKK